MHHTEFISYLIRQRIHILPDLVVGDLGINLGRGDMFMSQHLADRFQRYALRKRDRRRKGVATRVRRRVERQSGVSCHMAQGHIHRIIVFDRKNLIVR